MMSFHFRTYTAFSWCSSRSNWRQLWSRTSRRRRRSSRASMRACSRSKAFFARSPSLALCTIGGRPSTPKCLAYFLYLETKLSIDILIHRNLSCSIPSRQFLEMTTAPLSVLVCSLLCARLMPFAREEFLLLQVLLTEELCHLLEAS